jgi:hypothetical protein
MHHDVIGQCLKVMTFDKKTAQALFSIYQSRGPHEQIRHFFSQFLYNSAFEKDSVFVKKIGDNGLIRTIFLIYFSLNICAQFELSFSKAELYIKNLNW